MTWYGMDIPHGMERTAYSVLLSCIVVIPHHYYCRDYYSTPPPSYHCLLTIPVDLDLALTLDEPTPPILRLA